MEPSVPSVPSTPPVAPPADLKRRDWCKWTASLGAALPFLITLAPADARAQGSS
jgi:hypothetical protein